MKEIVSAETRLIAECGTREAKAAVRRVVECIEAAPEVEPVTRCKDCKKSSQTESGERYCTEPMGVFYGCIRIQVEDNFFCSGGVRKEETV